MGVGGGWGVGIRAHKGFKGTSSRLLGCPPARGRVCAGRAITARLPILAVCPGCPSLLSIASWLPCRCCKVVLNDTKHPHHAWCEDFLTTGGATGKEGSCCKADRSIYSGWCTEVRGTASGTGVGWGGG